MASVNDTSIRRIRLIYLQTPLCDSCPKLPSFAVLSKFLSRCVHHDRGVQDLTTNITGLMSSHPVAILLCVICSQSKEAFEVLKWVFGRKVRLTDTWRGSHSFVTHAPWMTDILIITWVLELFYAVHLWERVQYSVYENIVRRLFWVRPGPVRIA